MRFVLSILVVVLVGAGLYVRFAPFDPAAWHVAPPVMAPGDHAGRRDFLAVRDGQVAGILDEVLQVALSTPRTELVAGSVAEGRMTFVTRSALWHFPDYTTVDLAGDRLSLWGRARFGGSDWGVNSARITDWLIRLGLATS